MSAGPGLDLSGAILEGAYRLVRLIGQGGMGAVYEAVQLRLNKRVAVKIMSREHASNTVSLARFHREAEITSKLGHPNLVNVIDFGTSESGEPYLVMEFLDGEDLEARLHKVGCLPLEAAIRITRQAASALGAAHAQDVVHRDMKPANIFLLHVPGEQEFVKVLDFGISKMKAARIKLTRATAVVGTPLYMSPEQTMGKGEDTDHRADQWALACIAWEMLTGYPPFGGDDLATLFHQINRVALPPLDKLVPNLLPGVDTVLRKALSKRFDERYPSIREFALALDTAAFGRWAELSTPRQIISKQDLEEAGSGHGAVADMPSPVAEERLPAGQPQNIGSRNRILASVDPFHATHESVARTHPIWRRPSVAVAAGLVLLAGTAFGIRSSRPSPLAPPAVPAFPLVAQEKAVALPPIGPAQTVSLLGVAKAPVANSLKPTASRKRARIRQASAPGTTATTQITPKRKALKTQSKPKIFREL